MYHRLLPTNWERANGPLLPSSQRVESSIHRATFVEKDITRGFWRTTTMCADVLGGLFFLSFLLCRAYLRGDFPRVLSHTARGCKLAWKVSE